MAHFVDSESKNLSRALIGLPEMHGRHTADAVKNLVAKVVESFHLQKQKIAYYVTDSGSNMIAAFKDQVEMVQNHREEFVDDATFADEPNLDQSFIENDESDEEFQVTSQLMIFYWVCIFYQLLFLDIVWSFEMASLCSSQNSASCGTRSGVLC